MYHYHLKPGVNLLHTWHHILYVSELGSVHRYFDVYSHSRLHPLSLNRLLPPQDGSPQPTVTTEPNPPELLGLGVPPFEVV